MKHIPTLRNITSEMMKLEATNKNVGSCKCYKEEMNWKLYLHFRYEIFCTFVDNILNFLLACYNF